MYRLLFILFTFLCAHNVTAEVFFQNCSNVIQRTSYAPLKDYLENNNKAASSCQRLNNKEFLYTDASFRGNFFYCAKNDSNSLECEPEKQYSYYPSLSIEARFYGKGKKQFVLFTTHRLHRGVSTSSVSAFYFVPKSVSKRGYIIDSFKGAGAFNGLSSDSGKVCSNLGKSSNAIVPEKKFYEILNPKTDKLVIRFNQKIYSCNSEAVATQKLEYVWKNYRFRLLSDLRDYKR
ncbi:MAG: hypothetical protein COB79_03675 [Zetaproteobacteria bacterium]|nr:MAG: hypothetical protein COB79_03675 [Zetaproteobacteria bacterium]